MRMRGADILVKSLVAAGVDRVFSLSGNQIMPVYDACFELGVEIIHTRHEAAAVYMAEAYAQLTGKVGVAMVTAGAGAANAAGATFCAGESQTPVLLLTGDSPVRQDGMGAFQELDQVSMLAPVTKLSTRPRSASDIGHETARAIQAATSEQQGPVHMALAFDVVEEAADESALPSPDAFARVTKVASDAEVADLLDALSKAERPVILCGPAMNATRFDGLSTLSDALDAPVIPMESPRGLKDPSLGTFAEILKRADLVVNLGKRVDFTLAFGSEAAFGARTSWVDVQASPDEQARSQRNLGARLALSIAADPRDLVPALIEKAQKSDARQAWRAEVKRHLAERSFPAAAEGKISPEDLCNAVQRQLEKRESVLICDGGEFGQWAQAVCSTDERVINGISGAIGGGLCYGIAARAARPGSTVISLMGDGTVGFHFAEFETAVRSDLPFTAVIGNDLRWNAEHQIQLREYGPERLIGCQLSDARYDLAAQALGGHGEFVTEIDQLEAALDRAIASGKPACVNVMIDGLPAPSGRGH